MHRCAYKLASEITNQLSKLPFRPIAGRLTYYMAQVSRDGQRLCTTSADKSIKFYDVVSFDMSHMVTLKYTPTRATWIHERGRKVSKTCLVVGVGVVLLCCGKLREVQPLGDNTAGVIPHMDVMRARFARVAPRHRDSPRAGRPTSPIAREPQQYPPCAFVALACTCLILLSAQ